MKAIVVYVSRSGTTKRAAEMVVKGLREGGAQAESIALADLQPDLVKDADALLCGTPVYMAGEAAEWTVWWQRQAGRFALAEKFGGAFATAHYVHGGSEIAVQNLLRNMLVAGMAVYSGGAAYGPPMIHMGPTSAGFTEEEHAAAHENMRIYGKRFAEFVGGIKS